MTVPTRREFLKTASLGAAAVSMSAASYARVKGANERIALGLIGCGRRGIGAHMAGVHNHDKDENVEFVAVCDPWKVSRDNAAARIKEWYGLDAKHHVSHEELLADDSIDAVMLLRVITSTRPIWKPWPKQAKTPIAKSRWPWISRN